MVFRNHGKEDSSLSKPAMALVGGVLFFIIFAAWPNIAHALTGININMNPNDYRTAITQTPPCETAAAGYDPANNEQFNECKSVALVGLNTAQNIKALWQGGQILVVVVASAAVLIGALMRLKLKNQLDKTPIV